jgi:putative sigma-54 modulation protein
MNLQLTGVHLEITPNIREHVTSKIERVTKNADGITGISVTLSVEKIRHKAEATVRLRGKDIFVESEDGDLYAAVDLLVDKLDRQLTRHKDKQNNHSHDRMIEHLDD